MALAYLLATALLSLFLLPFVLSLFGQLIRHKSQSQRKHLLSKASSSASQWKAKTGASDEDGWEQIDVASAGGKGNEDSKDKDWAGIVGFFHPFCNAGGGGERVLWAAIRATQLRWPQAVCTVYTGDHEVNKEAIIKRVKDRFNIELNPPTVHFLYLSTRKYVLASTWPRFTLLGQSLGSVLLAFDAFILLTPDIFIDTMGYAFALYLCKLLFPKIPTAAYVHYPTISTDMLGSLDQLEESGKGLNAGAGKGLKGQVKRRYWQLFAAAYSWVGRSVDVVMTNSSWTQAHINQLWGSKRGSGSPESAMSVIFPPVAVEELEDKILVSKEAEAGRLPHLLYIAQFRPEKNHTLILRAFAQLLSSRKASNSRLPKPRLVLIGSVRDDADRKRVYEFRLQANELQIKDDVDFICDAPWPQVLDHLGKSSVGVNGMWNEHFGIGVVEYQAAGLISVVNNSGGPKEDIVVEIEGEPTGYHASTADEYATGFDKALSLSREQTVAMRLRARKSAQRFTEEAFASRWVEKMKALIELQKQSSR